MRARTVTEVSFEHAADKDLNQICVQLSGNNGVHFAEVRTEFGFGSQEHQAECVCTCVLDRHGSLLG